MKLLIFKIHLILILSLTYNSNLIKINTVIQKSQLQVFVVSV